MFKRSILILLIFISIYKYRYLQNSYWSPYYLVGNQYYYAFTNDIAKYRVDIYPNYIVGVNIAPKSVEGMI